ncbi:MAG: hypothetical protein IPH84_01395 [Bacteroidales bacterium]|nr:hypothetical protein [Bacteroidales bacterium]
MSLINNIRYRFARKNLEQEHQKLSRTRKPLNLDNSRYIALLYYIPDEDSYKKIEDLLKLLGDRNIKVKVACYTDQKVIPHYFIPKLMQDILTVKDTNWYYFPVKPFVKDFLQEEFDILIDLSLKEYIPLLYLAANAKASLKIGRFDESHQHYYDLMIDIPQDSTLEYFIEQVMHYLNKINTES